MYRYSISFIEFEDSVFIFFDILGQGILQGQSARISKPGRFTIASWSFLSISLSRAMYNDLYKMI